MPLTQVEFEDACGQTCPHCASGNVPRYRDSTKEWCHDFVAKSSFSHVFCQASGLRKWYEAQQQNG